MLLCITHIEQKESQVKMHLYSYEVIFFVRPVLSYNVVSCGELFHSLGPPLPVAPSVRNLLFVWNSQNEVTLSALLKPVISWLKAAK